MTKEQLEKLKELLKQKDTLISIRPQVITNVDRMESFQTMKLNFAPEVKEAANEALNMVVKAIRAKVEDIDKQIEEL